MRTGIHFARKRAGSGHVSRPQPRRCGLFVAETVRPSGQGGLIRFATAGQLANPVFSAVECTSGGGPDAPKSVKIVVGMQHTPTTFPRTLITPKKAAYACLFCFTQPMARSRLRTR